MLLQSVLHVNPIKWTRNTLLLYLHFYNKEMNNTWNVSKAINLFRSEGRAVFQDRSLWAGSLPRRTRGLHVALGQELVRVNISACVTSQSMSKGTLAQAADPMWLWVTSAASGARHWLCVQATALAELQDLQYHLFSAGQGWMIPRQWH